jgi:hypothetical protein
LSLKAIACGGFFLAAGKLNAEEKKERKRESGRQKAKMEAGTALPL